MSTKQWDWMLGITIVASLLALIMFVPRIMGNAQEAPPVTYVPYPVGPPLAPPTVATTTTAPPGPLCHPETPGAAEVSAALRMWWPVSLQDWGCRIAWCESRFRMDMVGEYNEIGWFQILPSVWAADAERLGFDLHNPDDNTRMALEVFFIQGPDGWTCNALI